MAAGLAGGTGQTEEIFGPTAPRFFFVLKSRGVASNISFLQKKKPFLINQTQSPCFQLTLVQNFNSF